MASFARAPPLQPQPVPVLAACPAPPMRADLCMPALVQQPVQTLVRPPAVLPMQPALQPVVWPAARPVVQQVAAQVPPQLHQVRGQPFAAAQAVVPAPAQLQAPLRQPLPGASGAGPQTSHLSLSLENINRHFRQMLQFVAAHGFFQGPLAGAQGDIRINIPFCGSFSEAPTMASFVLDELLPSIPGARSARLYCSDVRCCGTEAMTTMIPADPRLRYEIQEKDLGSEMLPPAELAIGLHPQPLTKTPDRLWERIIENVLRSSKRCLFTCWMKSEAEELVRICSSLGSTCSLQRNPSPLPEGVTAAVDETASMRFHYIVLTRQPAHP
uniref:Uncharacterized protein n=1 Tax=Alexandrium catenella TaxID=2925 RepID=A0A7S1WY14_ALECA